MKVLPIGGFKEVVAFLERNRAVLPATCRQRALLDGDVSRETLVRWRRENNPQYAIFQRFEDQIGHLPWAPEVGIVEYFQANLAAAQQALRTRFRDNQIRLDAVLRGYDDTLEGGPQRHEAKRVFGEISDLIHVRTGQHKHHVQDEICREYARLAWPDLRADMIRILVPVVE